MFRKKRPAAVGVPKMTPLAGVRNRPAGRPGDTEMLYASAQLRESCGDLKHETKTKHAPLGRADQGTITDKKRTESLGRQHAWREEVGKANDTIGQLQRGI